MDKAENASSKWGALVTLGDVGGGLVAVKKGGKAPQGAGWPQRPPLSADDVEAHVSKGGNIGVRIRGDLVAVDGDYTGADKDFRDAFHGSWLRTKSGRAALFLHVTAPDMASIFGIAPSITLHHQAVEGGAIEVFRATAKSKARQMVVFGEVAPTDANGKPQHGGQYLWQAPEDGTTTACPPPSAILAAPMDAKALMDTLKVMGWQVASKTKAPRPLAKVAALPAALSPDASPCRREIIRVCDDLAAVAEGGRHNALESAAARVMRCVATANADVSEEEARDYLRDACRRNGLMDDVGGNAERLICEFCADKAEPLAEPWRDARTPQAMPSEPARWADVPPIDGTTDTPPEALTEPAQAANDTPATGSPGDRLKAIVAEFLQAQTETSSGKVKNRWRDWVKITPVKNKDGEIIRYDPAGYKHSMDLFTKLAERADLIGPTLRYDGFAKQWFDTSSGRRFIFDKVVMDAVADLERASLRVHTSRVCLSPAQVSAFSKALAATQSLDGCRRVDSLADWMQTLPAWDGTPRARTLFQDALGCKVSSDAATDAAPENLEGGQTAAYLAAVGELVVTAMASRWSNPQGAGVHIMPVFVGPQKGRKGTFLKALAGALVGAGYVLPGYDGRASMGKPPLYESADFGADNSEYCRRVSGAAIVEFEEMQGYGRRDMADLKRFVTEDVDKWDVKYIAALSEEPRRYVMFGSTNSTDFLRRSGDVERRFAPIYVTSTLGDAEADKHRMEAIQSVTAPAYYRQLLAEGLHLAKAVGLNALHERVEGMLGAAQVAVSEEIPCADSLRSWLGGPDAPRGPFSTSEALMRLGLSETRAHQSEVAAALRSLGYIARTIRKGKDTMRRWVQAEAK